MADREPLLKRVKKHFSNFLLLSLRIYSLIGMVVVQYPCCCARVALAIEIAFAKPSAVVTSVSLMCRMNSVMYSVADSIENTRPGILWCIVAKTLLVTLNRVSLLKTARTVPILR